MKVVGITGGIGSGKTFIAGIFSHLGIPVYNSDTQARLLMETDPVIIRDMRKNFGEEIYSTDGLLNRKLLSNIIFEKKNKRLIVSAIVHPAVEKAFNKWKDQHFQKKYVIKESAILFESKGDTGTDFTICVAAPLELRRERIRKRDQFTEEKIQSIINNQMSEEERNSRCDFILINDNLHPLLPEIIKLHSFFSQIP